MSHATADGRPYDVRAMGPADAGRVLDHALAVHGDLPVDGDGVRSLLARLERDREGLFLAAVARGAVVGTVSVDGGTVGLSVRAGWRRQGVGRRLLADAIERARATGLARLVLEVERDNAAARALYRALGFREEGAAEDRLRMALEVGPA